MYIQRTLFKQGIERSNKNERECEWHSNDNSDAKEKSEFSCEKMEKEVVQPKKN